MSSSDISVVIPTYKASAFIEQTLQSVFAQSVLPAEIVIADDASPDDTVQVVDRIAQQHTIPIRVVRLQRNSGGPARPLNVGIGAARGEYVALLDHDDQMAPDRLRLELDLFRRSPGLGLVLGRLEGVGGSNRSNLAGRGWNAIASLPYEPVGLGYRRIRSKDAYAGLVEHGCYAMTCSAFFFPMAAWEVIGPIDERVRTACDYYLLQSFARHHDIGYVDAVIGSWACNPETLYSAAALQKRLGDVWLILNRFDVEALDRPTAEKWRAAVREFLMGAAWAARQAGDHRSAFRYYLTSLWRHGPGTSVMKGLARLAFESIVRK
jgi:glycosyltransferase involved in cell wall biosynthesis